MPKLSGFFTDPSSGEFSISRVSLLALVVDAIGLSIAELFGYKFGNWSSIVTIIGTVAGIYGVNSGLRVWHGVVLPKEKEGE